MTPQELRVTLSVYRQYPAVSGEEDSIAQAWRAWTEEISEQVGIDVADLRFALGRIVSAGLLDRVTFRITEEEIINYRPG